MNSSELRHIKTGLSAGSASPKVETSPSLQDQHTGHEESARRQKAIEMALQSILSDEHMGHAIRLCEHEFPADQPFSVSTFCQRLVETLPGVGLTAEARLQLLRTMRQSAAQLGADSLTSSTDIPRQWRQGEPQPMGRRATASLEPAAHSPEKPTDL